MERTTSGRAGPGPAQEKHTASERALIALLRLAYSGELAASHAFRGHWKATREEALRTRIREIEAEELEHRARVGEMLAALGTGPSWLREVRATLIGRFLGAFCRVSGALIPLYGAGALERKNVGEYERAARLAWAAGRTEWIDELLGMAEAEWEHERLFRERVLAHPLGRRLPIWSAPPPRAEVRASFEREARARMGTGLATAAHVT
jgi:demethoxyubiquinone hydroxylase (CLK1/Coq7/Cat5 family)